MIAEDQTAQIRADPILRKLGNEKGVHIDYIIGIRSKTRQAMMTGNMARMGQGDLALTSAFLMTLDQQLVMQGQPREDLKTMEVGFTAPVVRTIEDLTTTTEPTTPDPHGAGITNTTRAPVSIMSAVSSMSSTDPDKLASNPMFLGGAGIVFILLVYILVNRLRSQGRETGSYGSSTTASEGQQRISPKGGFGDLKLKNYRTASAPFSRRVDDSWRLESEDPSRSRGRSRDRGRKKKKRPSSSESSSSESGSGSGSESGSGSSSS